MLKRCALLLLAAMLIVCSLPNVKTVAMASYDDLLYKYQSSEEVGYAEYSKDLDVSAERQEIMFEANGNEAQWKFDIQQSGVYQIGFTYKIPSNSNGEVVRSILINGKVPFLEAKRIIFERSFIDNGEITLDNLGNDILPMQIPSDKPCFKWANGADGYYSAPYMFYLEKGINTVSLSKVSGELAVKEITVKSVDKLSDYKQALSQYKEQKLSEVEDFSLCLQAETPSLKSSSTLSAVSDRTSPRLMDHKGEFTDSINTRLNILGGGRFSASGMWVEYNIDNIPQDGLYRLSFKAKQDATKATTVARKIYINGTLPYKQAECFEFGYSSDYENVVFGDASGAYLVPLKKGRNTLRIESTLTAVAPYCSALENELQALGSIYRKFITVMGTNPDANRDYDIQKKLPQEVKSLTDISMQLFNIKDALQEKFGSSNYTSIINTIALQLERMGNDPYIIPKNVQSLNSNISSLGGVVNSLQETDLDLDYIVISGSNTELPRAQANIIERIGFTFKNFIYSFSMDYNDLSSGDEYESSIEVWFLGGREQAQVLKELVTSSFSETNKTSVTLKLVSVNNTLLQATLAGRGPDVALGITAADVMNYAYRKTLVELSSNGDFKAAAMAFPNAALTTLTGNGGVYGLPQTMSYPMLFYRADILDELKISVPKTWEEVYGILPILAQNNMTFGLPMPATTNTSFMSLLYQQGGSIYTDDLRQAKFYDETTIRVMRQWVKLHSSYALPISYDFVNRFAAGSMPLAIVDYSMYNNMCLYAPQMENQWSFTVIPGTENEDGTINHAASVTVTAAIIFNSSNSQKAAWEFIKWWTSSEIQGVYGNNLENLLGKAGRYATANSQALEKLPWSQRFYDNLMAQREYTFGVPEVPGGYYTNRYLVNAFMESYSNGTDSRETLYEYNITVNEELSYQREVLELE